jgi:NSS family neurotransmitter:Na+ symporter
MYLGGEEKPRETLLSKFGMFVAYHGATGGMGTLLIPAFMAVVWGGGAFYLWWMIGTLVVVVSIFLIDSCFGAYTRRAPPQAWHIITNGNKIFTFWIWFSVMALFIYMPTAAALYGIWAAYLVATPTHFWGPDPSTFFWKVYLTSPWPLICALILCFLWWFMSYKSVNTWARIAIWSKPVGILLAFIFIILSISYNPQFWQGWAMTFDLQAAKILSPMVFAQAMLWVYWRSGAGSAVPTVFASYLPKGGDINTSCIMERLSDIIFLIMAAMFIVPLTMGFGYPPVFGGSLGLSFSALPTVWTKMGLTGTILGMLFYALFIPAAFPMTLAYFELSAATFADKFGLPRTKSVTLTAIVIAVLSILFTLPIYDPVNWGSYGFTMIFTAWYWEILICGLACIAEYLVLFKYFKIDKLISVVNENSVVKLHPRLIKSMCYLGFIMVVASMSYTFVATTGLIPGIPAGAVGTVLADGTGYYGLTPIGLAMMFVGLGIPLILALIMTATD